jgi:maleamate amidohydrolase
MDQEFFAERGFGRPIGFGSSPGVLVIDLIGAFTDPTLPLGAPLDEVLANTLRVVDTARSGQLPVLFTTVAYDDGDLRDAGVWAAKMAGLLTLRAGTPEVEVDGRLGRRADEPLIVKKYASAFFGTDLISRLNAMRVDTLVITGCTTSGCVRATAVDAVQNGLRPIVVREAVGDRSRAAHEQSLFDLQAKYADVLGINDVLPRLRSPADEFR